MSALKWVAAIPAAVVFVITWPFAGIHAWCGSFLGYNEI